MSFSKVTDPVIQTPVQEPDRLVDETTIVHLLQYVERKTIRYYWINTSELQTEVDDIKTTEAANGWAIEGQVTRIPVHDVIPDLFNVVINLVRHVPKE